MLSDTARVYGIDVETLIQEIAGSRQPPIE
jgi:hypothetical protein